MLINYMAMFKSTNATNLLEYSKRENVCLNALILIYGNSYLLQSILKTNIQQRTTYYTEKE